MEIFYKDYSKHPNIKDIAIIARNAHGQEKFLVTGIETLTEAQRACQIARLALDFAGVKLSTWF